MDGAKRLQILINDLLTFSRVGRPGVVLAPVPLDQPLDVAIAALGTAIEESGTVIERPGKLPTVAGDATLLAVLWQNLISNAVKFRADDREPVVRINVAEQPADTWQFTVADNGIGIAPEFAEKVFVIFQRLHLREAYPGTGIGLALCKRIIEHHGGDISVDTGYQGGTRIWFTLPRIDPGPDGAGAAHGGADDAAHAGAGDAAAAADAGVAADDAADAGAGGASGPGQSGSDAANSAKSGGDAAESAKKADNADSAEGIRA